MNRTIWKTIFIIVLTIFTLLSVLLITLVYSLITQSYPSEMSIIGGADLPTFHLLMQTLLHSPIPYIWFGSFLMVIISLIGWLTSKK